jgi:hypothetical protein
LSAPETDGEIIATAMLLGAEFKKSAHGHWRCQSGGYSSPTGWYPQKSDAAIGFLHKRGFRLDFNGNIQEAT